MMADDSRRSPRKHASSAAVDQPTKKIKVADPISSLLLLRDPEPDNTKRENASKCTSCHRLPLAE